MERFANATLTINKTPVTASNVVVHMEEIRDYEAVSLSDLTRLAEASQSDHSQQAGWVVSYRDGWGRNLQ